MTSTYLKTGFSLRAIALSVCCFTLAACSGNASKSDEESKTDDEAFYKTQPVHSGFYNADYYDISGPNARKGRFDGRIYFSLSPETSAFKVFENGNHTKIDCTVSLKRPFERGDSGIYNSVDLKDQPVTVSTDSTMYVLAFHRNGDDYKITFSPKARYESSALNILEKMTEQKTK